MKLDENNIASRSCPVGMVLQDDSVPLKVGRAESRGGGKLFDTLPEKAKRKAVSFWARKSVLRKLPGHCPRCGHPHAGPLKNCDACRAGQKAHKAIMRRRKLAAMTPRDALALIEALTRRVASLEIAVATLQLGNREKYKCGYQKGFAKGRNALARNIEGLRGEHAEHRRGEQTSREELGRLNHAYEA